MSSFKKKLVLFLFFFFSSLAVLPVSFACEHGDGKKGACKADFDKFCANITPGEGRKFECLKEHQNELSPPCQEKMQKMKERHEAMEKDCSTDKEKFCSKVEPGQGRVWKCLREHEKKLSLACKTHFEWEKK